jgi:dTDP-glucose 4,6-dehydratase
METYLVTGGAGFIGTNFIRYTLQNDPEVRIVTLDALTYSGNLENLNNLPNQERHNFIHGNICDSELVYQLLNMYSVTRIVHFAAESHVDRSIIDPTQFIQTNIVGTYSLLESSRKYWTDTLHRKDSFRFHHISTDEVYGTLNKTDPAWTEKSPYSPNSPYSASKAASDHLVRSYGHTYDLPYTITNCSNNYGPYQFPEKLIPLMILNAMDGQPLPVYGDGQQVRDWVHVEDHCEAVALVIKKAATGSTYNVGGDNQTSNLTVVQTICDLLDELAPSAAGGSYSKLIKYVDDRPGHDRRYAMNITKINRDLGWYPKHTLGDGLRKTVTWYLNHQDWVGAIKKQTNFASWLKNNFAER